MIVRCGADQRMMKGPRSGAEALEAGEFKKALLPAENQPECYHVFALYARLSLRMESASTCPTP